MLRKKLLMLIFCAAILFVVLWVAQEMAGIGVAPSRLFLAAVALIYVMIALVKFPAMFFAPLLFISRNTTLPGTLFGRTTEIDAVPVCAVLLFLALFFRLLRMTAEREPLRDAFKKQGAGIAVFLGFAALVALSYSYTPSPLYGSAKLISFLVVGGLMFFSPFIIFRTENDFRHFAYGTVLVALAASVARVAADSRGIFWAHEPVTHIGAGQVIGVAIVLVLNYNFVRSRYARLLLLPCMLVLAVGLIASEVRGAVLALAIVLFASLFTPRRSISLISPRAAMLGLTAVIAALFIVPQHWFQGGAARMFQAKTQEITQFVDQGVYSWSGSGGQRLIFFGAALDGIAQKPLFGWGVGGWSYYFWHNDTWEYPHNVFLEIGVEQGLLGLAVYLIFLILAFKAAKRCFDEPGGSFAFVLPLLAYVVLLTCSTGDIDDCRFIWFTCSLAFAASRFTSPAQTEELVPSPIGAQV